MPHIIPVPRLIKAHTVIREDYTLLLTLTSHYHSCWAEATHIHLETHTCTQRSQSVKDGVHQHRRHQPCNWIECLRKMDVMYFFFSATALKLSPSLSVKPNQCYLTTYACFFFTWPAEARLTHTLKERKVISTHLPRFKLDIYLIHVRFMHFVFTHTFFIGF